MIKYSLSIAAIILMFSCCSGNSQQQSDTRGAEKNETAMDGEQLFKVNCNQCHLPGKVFVGPPLAGVEKRWKNKQLLYEFVRNSNEVIQKDNYAAELFEKWNEAPMLPFPQLTDREIEAILEYCNSAAASK